MTKYQILPVIVVTMLYPQHIHFAWTKHGVSNKLFLGYLFHEFLLLFPLLVFFDMTQRKLKNKVKMETNFGNLGCLMTD